MNPWPDYRISVVRGTIAFDPLAGIDIRRFMAMSFAEVEALEERVGNRVGELIRGWIAARFPAAEYDVTGDSGFANEPPEIRLTLETTDPVLRHAPELDGIAEHTRRELADLCLRHQPAALDAELPLNRFRRARLLRPAGELELEEGNA